MALRLLSAAALASAAAGVPVSSLRSHVRGATRATQAPSCDSVETCAAQLQQVRSRLLPAAPGAAAVVDFVGSALLAARADYHARAGPARGEVARARVASGNSTSATWCPNNSFFELWPVLDATLSSTITQAFWGNDGCFSQVTASASYNTSGVTVTLTGTGPTSLLCSDAYAVSTWYGVGLVEIGELSPTASAFLPFASTHAALNAAQATEVYLLPCGILGSVSSLLTTLTIFVGNTDADVENANYAFLTERNVWPRAAVFNRTTPVDKTTVKSGTYLAIARMDGLDPTIMWGTGGTTGHSALAVWNASGLYVSESTDVAGFIKGYWPPPYGIIVHEWDTWVSLAQAANYHVALLPPAPDVAAGFNETAFWKWFYTVQGQPYGYHTMLYSFMDTYDPLLNLPEPITVGSITFALNILDQLLPNSTYGISGFSMLTWGMNKRLNASCGTLACILDILTDNRQAGRPIQDLAAVMAIVENDDTKYLGNYSMVCSEYAAHGLKVGLAGAFPVWNAIQAAEQTPKDNYQLGIYDPDWYSDANCPGGVRTAAGAVGSYCQLMGPWELYLPGFNSIPIYPHMDETCAAQWPTYTRTPAQC